MHPILFQIGGIPVFSYGVLVATGVLLACGMAVAAPRAWASTPTNSGAWEFTACWPRCSVAKIWLIATAWEYYSANPREIFSVTMFQSGGTFYGGVFGGIIGVILYAHFQKMPLLPVFDICSAAIPLGHSIGRLGCFMAGCCFGKPTDVAWGVTFTNPVAAQLAGTPLGIHLHPTQLYEAALEFLNFLFLVWLGKRQRFSGQIAGTYMILYGFERGILEFFRGDPGRTMMFHDSISLMQIVSVILIAGGSLLWWRGLNGSAPLGLRGSFGRRGSQARASPHMRKFACKIITTSTIRSMDEVARRVARSQSAARRRIRHGRPSRICSQRRRPRASGSIALSPCRLPEISRTHVQNSDRRRPRVRRRHRQETLAPSGDRRNA